MKKTHSFVLVTVFFFALIAGNSRAAVGNQFLLIPIEARGSALGNSLIAGAEGISSIYWNPAGLTTIQKNSLIVGMNNWISDLSCFSLGYGRSLSSVLTLAAELRLYSFGGFEGLDKDGNTTTDFSASSFGGTIAAGYDLQFLQVGGLVLLTGQNYAEGAQNVTFSVDVGVKKELVEKKFSIGAVVKNLGASSAASSTADSTPLSVLLGAAYLPLPQLQTFLSLDYNTDSGLAANVGAEYRIFSILTFRAGYSHGFEDTPLSFPNGMNAGLGVIFKGWGLDLAWHSEGVLGNSVLGSLSWDF